MISEGPLKWYRIGISPDDDLAEITRKLERKSLDSSLFPHSVYVVRIASGFILEYGPKLYSPVVYIGQGKLRGRLTAHQKWLGALSKLLHGAPLEASFCFPCSTEKGTLHKQFEAHLLHRFKDVYGQLPLNNKKLEKLDTTAIFAKKLSGQIFSHGSGKRYSWVIRPYGRNTFAKESKK